MKSQAGGRSPDGQIIGDPFHSLRRRNVVLRVLSEEGAFGSPFRKVGPGAGGVRDATMEAIGYQYQRPLSLSCRAAIACLLLSLVLVAGLMSSPSGETAKSAAELMELGDDAFAEGRYPDAVELYRSALAQDEGNFTARRKLIELLARLEGREEEARKEVDVALGIEDLSPEQIRLIAEICSANGFPDKARSAYELFVEKNPTDSSALCGLLEILFSQNDLEAAEKRIREYEENPSSTVEGLGAIARKCFQRFQYPLALLVYDGVLKRDDGNLAALTGMGECLTRLGNFSEAADKLSAAAKRHPERPEPLTALGELSLRTGDYPRAEEPFKKALSFDVRSAEAADGYARVLFSTGKYHEARKTLTQALETQPNSPVLLVSLGRLLRYIGEHESARNAFEKALAANPGCAGALVGLGMLYLETGKQDLAKRSFSGLYDFWDAHVAEIDSVHPRDMLAVAIACVLTDNPQDAIDVLEKDLKRDPTDTEALLWESRLFFERHQPTDAIREVQKLLRINPNHPEAHAALARIYVDSSQYELATESCERALKANPNLIEALDLLSSMQILDFDYDGAKQTLNKALSINPRSLSSLSFLASCYWQEGKREAYEEVRKRVFGINTAYADFYLTVSRTCENKRRNEEAIGLLKEAVSLKPDCAPAYASLGVILMREGEEEEAEKYLRESYRLDIYNPRTTNFINLLQYMRENFESTRTEYFLVKWDREKDALLALFLPEYLENLYSEICGEFGYHPKNPTLVEMFDSHDQFSARIIGLPFIATVGASLGKVVAADSPKKATFNWKDVLRHEFVHVVTLQQSKMQIPFWLTEGLATRHEQSPLPAEWDGLVARMLYLNQIIPLKDLNSYFTRPKTPMHKQAAYAEAHLICQYLYEKYGPQVVQKMTEKFGENLTTEGVIQQCLSMSLAEFERQIAEYIFSKATEIKLAPLFLPEDRKSIAEKLKEHPESSLQGVAHARCLYDQAAVLSDGGQMLDEAVQILTQTIERDPKARGAYSTLAEIHLSRQKYEDAKDAALKAIALDEKDFLARRTLGFAYEKMGKKEEAIEEFLKAAEVYPRAPGVWQALARLYSEEGDEEGKIRSLEGHCRFFPKDMESLKRLAQIYVSRRDYDNAVQLLERALSYNLYDVEIYRLMVEALRVKADEKSATKYAGIGAEAAYISAKSLVPFQKDRVVGLLKLALELNPSHEGAKSLLRQLTESGP